METVSQINNIVSYFAEFLSHLPKIQTIFYSTKDST